MEKDNAHSINILLVSSSKEKRASFSNALTVAFSKHSIAKSPISKLFNQFSLSSFETTNPKASLSIYSPKGDEESAESTLLQLKQHKRDMHFLFILYSSNHQEEPLTLILPKNNSKTIFIIFESEQDYASSALINKYYLNEDKIAIDLLKVLPEVLIDIPLYDLYMKHAKEKHYRLFISYYARKGALLLLNERELIELFNSFETFSFDDADYPDDSVIILQALSLIQWKNRQVTIELRSRHCAQCKTDQSICKFNSKEKLYLCDICSGIADFAKLKTIQCNECKAAYEKQSIESYVLTACCQKYYCVLCFKTQIKSKEEEANSNNDLGMITCFCGKGLERVTIKEILDNASFSDLFDFHINQLEMNKYEEPSPFDEDY